MAHISRRIVLAMATGAALSPALMKVAAQDTLRIATSMPILQDIVANIAGDDVEVFSIIPANSDPHTWEPNPEDMVRLAESDAFIFIGADLEPFVETGGWHDTVHERGIPEFQVTDHVELIVTEDGEDHDHADDEHDHTGGDPHIWLDPLTIVQAIPAIASFLGEISSGNADSFTANAEAYTQEIEALHTGIEESFSVIPENRRKLLVFHDAWQYFAARYGFEIVGIVLENPNAELSAQEMVNLLEVVDEQGVNVIFAEPQFNTSALDLLQAEGDIEIAILLTDSFAEGVDTYIDLMKFNRDQIVNALGE